MSTGSLSLSQLVQYLDQLLQPRPFQDYGPNGLQVQGPEQVRRIGFAVSACLETIDLAIKNQCDTLIVHHGILWKHQGARPLTGPHGERVRKLITHGINLIAYHLPLDAHLDVGNAASLARLLGLTQVQPFCDVKGQPYGVWGHMPRPQSAQFWQGQLEKILGQRVLLASAHPEKNLQKLGIITGGANNDWDWCLRYGIDGYLTGEISEYNWHDAREAGIHYFAGGHHATERYGVLSLMAKMQRELGGHSLEYFSLDIFNPA